MRHLDHNADPLGEFVPFEVECRVRRWGNLVTANNVYARISRTYNLNGSMATDTLRIRTSVLLDSNFTTHVYGLRYGYDLNGRRTSTIYPANVMGAADSAAIGYDPVTGAVAWFEDVSRNRFTNSYDAAGRLFKQAGPWGIAETYTYDEDGRQVGRQDLLGTTVLHADSLHFDARGKVVSARYLIGGTETVDSSVYSGMGVLIANQTGNDTQHWQDAWQVDGLGNYLDHQRVDQTVRRWDQIYDSSGTLLYLGAHSTGGGSAFQDTTRYDYIGQGSVYHIDTYAGFNLSTFKFLHTKLTNVYRADNLLMAAETKLDSTISTTTDNAPTLYTEHEEYRYDALGRRIWVRSIHGATCLTWYPNADCASALKREVWDGSALLYESRYPGDLNLPSATLEQETGGAGGSFAARFGRVAYLSGGALDHPLDVIKMDGAASSATFAPRYNWRGLAEEPVCAAGQSCGTQYFGASSPSAYFELAPTPNGPAAWSGSLIEGQRDASGLLYKRNRYYDPASGRFTSQDPLGLGGGLNVYGFAGGDPVNNDDPFGDSIHVEGAGATADVAILRRSATFRRIYDALNSAPKSKVDLTVVDTSEAEVLRFSAGSNAAGYSIRYPFTHVGRTEANLSKERKGAPSEILIDEFVHQAGYFAPETGTQTGVPGGCENHDSSAEPVCQSLRDKIRSEASAAPKASQ